jgi:hypothetical protein
MTTDSGERACPYCMEKIHADAIKCRHCGSAVAPERPPHGGTCPYCKEQIHPDAVRCKYCQSDLRRPEKSPCAGCGSVANRAAFARRGGDSIYDSLHEDCIGGYVRCRGELGGLGVPDEDAINYCAFKYWGCTVRNNFLDEFLGTFY